MSKVEWIGTGSLSAEALLAELLARAREGGIRSIVVGYADKDDRIYSSWSNQTNAQAYFSAAWAMNRVLACAVKVAEEE